MTFTGYRHERFFDALDGVRALAVLLVVLHHMTEKSVWYWLNGFVGVEVFFVLSGFLITTLCLREMDRSGPERHLSLSRFYTRRFFRIVPLYFLALLAYGVLTGLFGVSGSWTGYVDNLPFYATLNGDLVKGQPPFEISWSLGVEEKFYIAWPLVLVATKFMRRGALVALSFVLVAMVGAAAQLAEYPGFYLSITLGCSLAFALNHPGCYDTARRLVSVPGIGFGIAVAVLLTGASLPHYDGTGVDWPGASTLALGFYPAVAALIGYVVIHPQRRFARAMSKPVAVWIGKRSYAIYLFHAMTIHVVDEIVAPRTDVVHVAGRLMLVLGITFTIAALVHRVVEVPLIQRGRKITAGRAKDAGTPQRSSPLKSSDPS